MSFENFQTLPSHNLDIPQFHPAPVPPPPVYNTTEMIAPLMKLAAYMSPEARATRKAAIAKANYEARLYGSTDPRTAKDPFFYYRVRKYNTDEARSRQRMATEMARTDAYVKKLMGGAKGGTDPEIILKRKQRDFPKAATVAPIDMASESTPPPPEEPEATEPDSPETQQD